MQLSDDAQSQRENLLPVDGTVIDYGVVVSTVDADRYLRYLLTEIPWRNDEAVIYGKRIITKRKVAWHADQPFEYVYSKTAKTATLWTAELLTLKGMVEQLTSETFNSCLLNLYHDGSEGMSWHSDAEITLKKDGAIASLSFGASRRFSFRHKQSAVRVDTLLEHGSLLIMKGTTQCNWQHCLPKTSKAIAPRVNLTFRTVVGPIERR